MTEKHYFKYGQHETDYLRKRDKKLGSAIDHIGIIKREVQPDVFTALIDSVIGQQISSKAADTVCARLRERCNITPKELCALTREDIQSCGMSMRKAEYIKNISEAAEYKTVDFDALAQMSDAEVIGALTAIKGIGVWTAEMMLIFSLQRPNVISYGDLAIRRGMMMLYGLNDLSKERFSRYAKRYSPYGSVASLYLWALS